MCMLKKLFAKLKPKQEEKTGAGGGAFFIMRGFLDELKNIFAEELLIDPRIRDYDATTYGNGCRQRCNKIMEATTAVIEKIKDHIEQNEELHAERENFLAFVDSVFDNLKQSSGKLNGILGQTDMEDKERQLKCYNLGMTVQQSTRAMIDAYISSFNSAHK